MHLPRRTGAHTTSTRPASRGVSLLTMTGAVSTILTVLILAGATARLTRLVTEDTITGPMRAAIMRRSKNGPDGWAYLWVSCPWCVGLWIAAAVTLAAWCASLLLLDGPLLPVPAWLWVPGLALTNNYLAARLQA
jgi:hypothetical protein